MTLAIGNNVEILVFGDAGDAHYAELMRAWRWTNSLLQPKVKDIVATLPTGATEGDVYIVTGGSMPNQLARWTARLATAAWEYMAPKAGWEVRVQSQLDSAGLPKTYGYNGNAWVEKPGGSGGSGGGTGGDVYLTKAIANGVLDLSATTANLWGVTLTSNVTTLTLPTTANYYSMSVIFTQDSTGGRTVAFPSSVKWTNGPVALNTAPGTTTILSFLTVDKGVNWFGFAAPATGSNTSLTNPMTSAGDLIVGGTNGVPSRLPKGPDGTVLTMVNGALAWAASTGGAGFGAIPIADLRNSGVTNTMNTDWWNKYNRVTGAVQVQIPLNADVAAAVATEVVLEGVDSSLTIAGVNGVTLLVPAGRVAKTRSKSARALLKKVATDTWVLSGDLLPTTYDFASPGGYTLQDRDRGAFVRNTDSKGVNVPITLPAGDSWIGVEVTVLNWNGASIQFNNGTIRLPPGKKNTSTQAGQVVRLKCLESGTWSVSGELDNDGTSSVARVVDVTDANFTVGALDRLYIRYAGSGGSATILGETASETGPFTAGAEIHIEMAGPNQFTVTPGSGVTINCPAGFNKKPAKQYAVVTLKRVAKDVWTLIGYLEPSS